LLEEINRKLSGADQILSKAKAKIEGLEIPEEEIKNEKPVEEKKRLDLYRIYSTEKEKTSAVLLKIRDLQKENASKVEAIEKVQDALRDKCDRRLKKLGV
jgi:hypothetical protein